MALIRAQIANANPDTLRGLVAALRAMETTLRNGRISGQHSRYRVDEEHARQMVHDRWTVVDSLVKMTEEIGAQQLQDWCVLPPDLKTWLRGAIRSAGHDIEYVGVDPDLNVWRRAMLRPYQQDAEDEEEGRQANNLQFFVNWWYGQGTWQNFTYQVQSLRVDIESVMLAPPTDRISYDHNTREVILDGKRIRVEHAQAFRLFCALIDAHNGNSTPITGANLYQSYSRKPKDPRPDRAFAHLPETLCSLIVPAAGIGGGYSLCLPGGN